MTKTRSNPEGPSSGFNPPRIEYLRVQNYRALRDVEFKKITPLMVLLVVEAEPMPDGRLLLQIKDAPFEKPVLARFASDGTLKMLSYLVVLMDPQPPQFIGIEEPENFLHPRLLRELAEECSAASEKSQLLVTTHSPFFLNGTRPAEVRVIYRDEDGYSQVVCAKDIEGVKEFVDAGASLGHLWMEGRLGPGDPLVNAGVPARTEGR